MRALFLILVLLLLCPTVTAQASPCPRVGPPSVSVGIDMGPVQGDHSKTIAQLTELGAEPMSRQAALSGRQHVPLGLTSAQIKTAYELEGRTVTQGDGTVCTYLYRLTIQLSNASTMVYIAREIPSGTCINGEVTAHENKHVAVNNAVLRDYQSRLADDVRTSLQNLGAIAVRSRAVAMQSLSDQVKGPVEAAVKRMDEERLRRQAQIDTPQEYDRVSRACNGEAQRYVRQALRN